MRSVPNHQTRWRARAAARQLSPHGRPTGPRGRLGEPSLPAHNLIFLPPPPSRCTTETPMNLIRLSLTALCAALALSAPCRADVTLPAVISDNMVLQKGKASIWGKADPKEKVTVK